METLAIAALPPYRVPTRRTARAHVCASAQRTAHAFNNVEEISRTPLTVIILANVGFGQCHHDANPR
eukprot:11147405-Alexandrium_andersonii.AAC.1